MANNKAPWITVEGVDGAGKSSHIEAIAAAIRDAGFEVTVTREPGGTELGERLREEILTTPMGLSAEVMLVFASRAEHMDAVINPALNEGSAVLCDRFVDSTYAYQGCGYGYPLERITALEDMVVPGRRPDMTLLFDLPVAESMRRLGGTGKVPDKFESQPTDYFERVRGGYLQRASDEPERFRIIDSSPAWEVVHAQVIDQVKAFLADFAARPSRRIAP